MTNRERHWGWWRGVGGVRGFTAIMACRNGLMGANELEMCHNTERAPVHLGSHAANGTGGRERSGDARRSDVGVRRVGVGWMGHSPLCTVLSPLATTNRSTFPSGAEDLPARPHSVTRHP